MAQQAISEMIPGGFDGLKASVAERAVASEENIKLVLDEVKSRGLQLARVERNMVEIAKRLGLTYLQ